MHVLPTAVDKVTFHSDTTAVEQEHSTEFLQISFHTRLLVLSALDKYKSVETAARKLGVTTRTLYNYKKAFGIAKNRVTGKYEQVWSDTPAFRQEIICHLNRLPDDHIWGICLRSFAAEAHRVSSKEFLTAMKEIKQQITGCPIPCKRLFRDSFILFRLLNIPND